MKADEKGESGLMHSILVSSNCQTAGIAAALQAMFPRASVIGIGQPGGQESPEVLAEFSRILASVDAWVRYVDCSTLMLNGAVRDAAAGKFIVDIPHINFTAFHPDYCFTSRISTGRATRQHFSSRIIAWSYQNGLSPRQTLGLFNARTYERLGYFAAWDQNVEILRAHFGLCGLDFARFFLPVKRSGAFMYVPEHPKVHVLLALARLVAVRLGCPEDVAGLPVAPLDTLIGLVQWPVYPEIAERLSVPSSNRWLVGSTHYDLESFIESVFDGYLSEGAPPDDIVIEGSEGVRQLINTVLREEARCRL